MRFLLIFWISALVSAQEIPWSNPNLREKAIHITQNKGVALDSLKLITESLVLSDSLGNPLPRSAYRFEQDSLYIDADWWNQNLMVKYYVYPNSQPRKTSSFDRSLVLEELPQKEEYARGIPLQQVRSKPFGEINSRGSLLRGISFGNNQSASVQSTLDLQLDGKLSKDIRIKARLYDHNLPVENNGYTQQINEFEQILIELYNESSGLRAGFIPVTQTQDYFANFNRQVTGLQAYTNIKSKNSETYISALGSVSRGIFHRMRFTATENNYGPYRLTGKNNEPFIIIIPNSEKIYKDGILLEKGEEKDYTLNYNTGELLFNPNVFLTGNSRITAEFQYSANSFNRFFVYGEAIHKREKFQLAAHFYSDADQQNNPIQSNLSDEDIAILQLAGNNRDLMVAPSEQLAEYDSNKILYRKITVGGNTIYEYSNDPTEMLYQVGFTFVGNNQGDYIKSNAAINGKVFEYIPPIAGVPQGNYEPIRQLIAPNKTQVTSLNSTYEIENGMIGVDLALSTNDNNLFSDIDDENNSGFASRLRYQQHFQWNKWKTSPSLEYSFIQENFTIIDRINSIEFYRDFNIENEFSQSNRNNVRFSLNTQYDSLYQLRYELDYINDQDFYTGFRNRVQLQKNSTHNRISGLFSHLATSGNDEESKFLQYGIEIEQKLGKKWSVGTRLGVENNERVQSNETYNPLSFAWREASVFQTYGDSLNFNFRTELYYREDDSIRANQMENLTQAKGMKFNTLLYKNKTGFLQFNGHYRLVDYTPQWYDFTSEEYLLGGVEWSQKALNEALQWNIFYELGTGQEPEREFQYVKVTDGQGIYKWTDYNNNGIEEINEFELAEFQDLANYIRVFTENVGYFKSNTNRLKLYAQFQPKYIFTDSDFWERWMFQMTFQNNAAFQKNGKSAEFNPFETENQIRNTENFLAIARFNTLKTHGYQINYTFNTLSNSRSLFTGYESNDKQLQNLQFQYQQNQKLLFSLTGLAEKDNGFSEAFSNRNYQIRNFGGNIEINYTPNELWSMGLEGSLAHKTNKLGEEELNQKELRAFVLSEQSSKTQFSAEVSFIDNQFTGNNFSVTANRMMQGLRPGSNWVWNITWQQKLTDFLFLNIQYNGRKTETTSAIHIGNVQLRLVF